MGSLLDVLFDAFGMVLAHPATGAILGAAAASVVILWGAAAWWVFQDAGRRVDAGLVPYLAAAGVVLATPVLFPLAVIGWRVARPTATLDDARFEALEASLVHKPDGDRCPECGVAVDVGWVRCPGCRSTIAASCAGCARPVAREWDICPWCATEVGGAPGRIRAVAGAEPSPDARVLGVTAAMGVVPAALGRAARSLARVRRVGTHMETPHDPGGDRTVRREARGRPRHRPATAKSASDSRPSR